MKTRNNPALLLVAITAVFLLVGSMTAWAQSPNSVKLFVPTAVGDSVGNYTGFSSATSFGNSSVTLGCGNVQGLNASVSSTPTGGNIFTDNFIYLTVGSGAQQNICKGGDNRGIEGPGTNCFQPQWLGGHSGENPDTFVNTYGVPALDISSLVQGGLDGNGNVTLRFDLEDFGGELGSSTMYLVTNCSINPLPPAPVTVTTAPGQTSTVNFGSFKQAISQPDTDTNDHTVTITATSKPSTFGLGPNFPPPASCLVYDNNGTTSCWLLQFSCAAGDDCSSLTATLANSFNLPAGEIVKQPGFLKTDDPACTSTSTSCNFTSNQISDFNIAANDPVVKAPTSPPGGYSFWMVTNNTSNKPFVSITVPANGAVVNQGDPLTASYSCTPANPVLSAVLPAACVATQGTAPNPSGTVGGGTQTTPANGVQVTGATLDTSVPGTHYVQVTATDSLTAAPPCNIFDDPSNPTTPDCPGGGETASTYITYTVTAPAADVAILKAALVLNSKVKKNTNFNYLIGISNLKGSATSGPVTVTDNVPAGLTIVGTPKGTQESCSIVTVHGRPTLSCTNTAFNCSVAGNTVTCTPPNPLLPLSLSNLNGATITITVKAANAGPVSNTATVSYSNDSNSSNNSSTANTTITN